MSFLQQIDKAWTLFLDRDGVINVEKDQDYIRNRTEFRFYPGVREHFAVLNRVFGRVLVVTNQRGIGRGLMSEAELHDIHAFVQDELRPFGARIDGFYFAPDLDQDAPNRKPNTGMGLQAKQDFPEIDFDRSVMVGNNLSDMEFGIRLGMQTVYVHTTKPLLLPHEMVSMDCPDLTAFCRLLENLEHKAC